MITGAYPELGICAIFWNFTWVDFGFKKFHVRPLIGTTYGLTLGNVNLRLTLGYFIRVFIFPILPRVGEL